MNKWKVSFFVSLLALLITSSVWLYTALDMSVSYTYQQVSLDEKENAMNMLGALIVEGGKMHAQKDILHFLRKTNKDAFIVENENIITIRGVKFIFENGRLSEVKG